jgi:hypothetical protein
MTEDMISVFFFYACSNLERLNDFDMGILDCVNVEQMIANFLKYMYNRGH